MLAKKFKIGSRERLTFVLKKGAAVRSALVTFRFLPKGGATSHFGIVVSKKISPKAVTRNKVRRQIFAAITQNWNLICPPCYDVVVLVSPRIVKASFAEIEANIRDALKKLFY